MKDWVDKWDPRFLEMASLVASWSKDPSTKVGAVITTINNEVVSVGYNGFPRGMSDDPELYNNREEKLSRIVHAEINAVMFAKVIPEYACLYVWPFMPCDRCAVQCIQAGILRFVAPRMPADRIERWGAVMERAKGYINECGGEVIEI